MRHFPAIGFLLVALGCATSPVLAPDRPAVTDENQGVNALTNVAPIQETPVATIQRIEVELDGTRLVFKPFGDFPMGFKVVWSKNTDPTFPTRPGDLAVYRRTSDPHEVWLKPFAGDGQYFVRVFEFLGGTGTGLVSRTLTVKLP